MSQGSGRDLYRNASDNAVQLAGETMMDLMLDAGMQPSQIISLCFNLATFMAISHKEDDLSRLDLEETLVKTLRRIYRQSFDSKYPHALRDAIEKLGLFEPPKG